VLVAGEAKEGAGDEAEEAADDVDADVSRGRGSGGGGRRGGA
jgi:hypothetical protein